MSHGNPIAFAIAPPAEGPVRKRGIGSGSLYKRPGHRTTPRFICCALGEKVLRKAGGLTYSVSHTKRHVCNGVHAAVDRHVPQVYQVAHDGHHRRVHHACGHQGTQSVNS